MVIAQSSGTRSRVFSSSAARKAATASSSRAVPPSRSPELGARPQGSSASSPSRAARAARVFSSSAARKAATASSSRAVPLSRSPSVGARRPRFICVIAQSSGTRSRVYSSSAARKAATASPSRAVPFSRSPSSGARRRGSSASSPSRAASARGSIPPVRRGRRRPPPPAGPCRFSAPRASRIVGAELPICASGTRSRVNSSSAAVKTLSSPVRSERRVCGSGRPLRLAWPSGGGGGRGYWGSGRRARNVSRK